MHSTFGEWVTWNRIGRDCGKYCWRCRYLLYIYYARFGEQQYLPLQWTRQWHICEVEYEILAWANLAKGIRMHKGGAWTLSIFSSSSLEFSKLFCISFFSWAAPRKARPVESSEYYCATRSSKYHAKAKLSEHIYILTWRTAVKNVQPLPECYQTLSLFKPVSNVKEEEKKKFLLDNLVLPR